MKRKNSFAYILFYIQLTFVGIFILVLCAYSISVKQTDFLKRGMYSENVAGVQLSSEYLKTEKGEIVDLQISTLPSGEDYMLYKYLSEEATEIIRGVYGTSDVFNLSKYLESGRFFSDEDYQAKKPVAVIGCELLDQTYLKNEVRYYGYSGQEYEVIGVFEETGEALDRTAYLNLTSLLETIDHYGLYYVDANDPAVVQAVIDAIKSASDGQYTISDVTYEPFSENVGLNGMLNMMLVCAILSAILNLLLTVTFFVTRQKYATAIRKLCGMTGKEIFADYARHILPLLFLAYGSVLLIIWVGRGKLGFFFELDNLSIIHFLVTGAVMLLSGLATIFYISRLANGVDISMTLKGR